MINRQKLIEEIVYTTRHDVLYGSYDCYEGNEVLAIIDEIIDLIKSQPPADQWIPCSERLPEEDGSYLCTYGKYHMGVYRFSNDLYSIDDYDFTDYKGVRGFYVYDSEWGYSEADYITAWMPLPKPYKGVE